MTKISNLPHHYSSPSLNLPAVQGDEFLPRINPWLRLGALLIAGSVLATMLLSAVVKYKVIVRAQATLRPTGELRLVQASVDGVVKSIAVSENGTVKKNDVIAILDDSRLQTQKSQLQSQIQQAQLQLGQINAQIRSLNSQIVAETERSQRTVVSAQADLSNKQRDYRDRKITTTAEVQEAEANLQASLEDWQKAIQELKSAQANLRSTEASLQAAMTKRDRYRNVAEMGALSLDQYEEAKLSVTQQEQAVQSQKAGVEAQKRTVAERQQSLQAAKARLERVKTSLNPTQSEITIAQSRIAQEKASGRATLATLNKEKESLIASGIELQKKYDRDNRELQQIEIDLGKTTITATADGTISKLNLRNPGQSLRAGEEVAQIVPSQAPLVIKAMISPSEIGKLQVGQSVGMRVSACPYPDYGTLKGVVSQISKDTVTSSSVRNTTASTPSYEVIIVPQSLILGKKNKCTIQSGMEGRADIVSKEETVLQFLLRKARLTTNI